MTTVVDGFLLVDKPGGWTSHDVVAKARQLLAQKKVGHSGTLDPMATGLVVLGLGRATRTLRYTQEAGKRYVATAQFGVATDTLDADGAILSRSPMSFEEGDLAAIIPRFVGSIMQVPPMVSALKIGGRKLYELAREGKEVERQPRPVQVYEIELLDFAPGSYPEATFRVDCGSGTYIRTLADDFGRALGGHAHLTALRRTRVGKLTVDRAHTIDYLEGLESVESAVLPMTQVLIEELQHLVVSGREAVGVRNGRPLGLDLIPPSVEESPFCVLDADGTLLAVYISDGVQARPQVVLS
ncbi:MAG: tRNA pseudouridine(55) synthase TruB [Acidimicrobiia bacterium]|nr:tRNA pseudouridine(55) synthase TruB [Acidimicrobiia bacterium]